MKKIIFLGALGMFFLGSCQNHSGTTSDEHSHTAAEAPDVHDGHGHETHGGDEIILPPAKAQAAGIVTSTVEPGRFQQVIRTSGQVLAAQGDEQVAVATVAGVVSFRGRVIEGMSVRKGSPLVVLSSQNMAEGDPVQKARVAYEVSKKEYERMQALVGDKIVSEKEFAQAKQTYENARISYEAVARNHTEHGQTVSSPIAGYVKSLLVKEGDYVSVGQPLVSVTQNRRLFLRADVSEKYYADLSSVSSANFRTPYNYPKWRLLWLNAELCLFLSR